VKALKARRVVNKLLKDSHVAEHTRVAEEKKEKIRKQQQGENLMTPKEAVNSLIKQAISEPLSII
jgi:hypothetical protein